MDRKEQLLQYVCESEERQIYEPIIDEFLFLEGQLTELKKLPFIQVKKDDPTKQRTTPAAKQYKELLQQYSNLLRILQRKANKNDGENGESPLRAWVKKHVNR